MKLRQKRRNSHISTWQTNYQPVIGLMNPLVTLDCHIDFQSHSQKHKFGLNFQHPLEIVTKISQKCKKFAFDKLLHNAFEIKIEERTMFVPEALLTGRHEIISDYKKLLERSKIGSYIPLNIKHREVSREKRRPMSHDQRQVEKMYQSSFNSRVFNEKSVNQKTSEKIKQTVVIHDQNNVQDIENEKRSSYEFTSHKKKIISTHQTSKQLHREVVHDLKTKISSTQIKNKSSELKQSKSAKKSKALEAIKINYIGIKSQHPQNPELSTFIYKSNTKSIHNPTEYARTQYYPQTNFKQSNLKSIHNYNNLTHHDINNNADLSFSVNQDKISHQYQYDHDDRLSEQFGTKSMKNSEVSQFTQRDLHTNDIWNTSKERKILKKQRNAVYVETFETKDYV